jgi:hypothetical protein
MIDYSESLIKIAVLVAHYRKLVLQGKFDAAADAAVDMQIVVVDLQQWTEAQVDQSAT